MKHSAATHAVLCIAVTACGSAARLPVTAGIGATPVLPPPETSFIPRVNVVEAKGWRNGKEPKAAAGLEVNRFASGLSHPRWIYVLPNGDVLVAETNAPERPEDGKGVKGFFMKRVMKSVGAAVPSANRITLLRDTDGDGVAETRSVLLDKLNSPFGIALIGDNLYVAN